VLGAGAVVGLCLGLSTIVRHPLGKAVVHAAVSGALGAAVCTPLYALGRVGILMLGSPALVIPGIVLVAVGFTLEAGATGAVKAIKTSAKLVAGRRPAATDALLGDSPHQRPE
jgi:hypothetical protein